MDGDASSPHADDSDAMFAQMAKVDMHIHANTSEAAFLEQAEADGFVQLVSMNAPVPFWCSIEEQEAYVARLRATDAHGDRLGYITAFTMEGWTDPHWAERTLDRLRHSFACGALGVKVWKNLGMDFKDQGRFVMVDDPKLDAIYDYIEKEGKILVGHCGEPQNCWLPLCDMTTHNDRHYFRDHPEYHMYLHPEVPSYEQQLAARDNMLAKHPGLRFCGAHLASLEWSTEALGQWLEAHPRCCVDFAHRVGHMQYQRAQRDRPRVRAFFERFQDQLVYGTDLMIFEGDAPAQTQRACHATWRAHFRWFATDEAMEVPEVDGAVRGIALAGPVLRKLYCGNAMRFFRGL